MRISWNRILAAAVLCPFALLAVQAQERAEASNMELVGYYIPAANANTDPRCGGARGCKGIIQTNNVEVDDRGYIYIVDRARSGMHILELTAPARATAAYP